MRLWTWQNQTFNITNPTMPVESKKHSKYLNICSRSPDMANKHLKEYEKLWSILKTDQFLWCYTDIGEATNSSSPVEYKGKLLWELDVPEDRILAKICGMAWHWIISSSNTRPGPIFENLFRGLLPSLSWNYHEIPFEPIFNKHWRDMKPQQLWNCLFFDCGVQQCYQVLVRHPVDSSWVLKDPQKDTNWWQKH
jgi:hypothetical protein